MNAPIEVGALLAPEQRLVGRALRAVLQTRPDWVPTLHSVDARIARAIGS